MGKVTEITPSDIDAYYNMGVAYIVNCMFGDAANAFRNTIETMAGQS